MLYSGILWSTVGGILILWAILRTFSSNRLSKTFNSAVRRYTLSSTPWRGVFGHTTKLQVIILFSSLVYLSIFSFAGIKYKTWITPIKAYPNLHNTRTSLGPWSDRIGTLAFALTPLSILLSQRESLLSLITGIPYHHFNFLHRWLGHLILLQSLLHTIGWVIIEVKLYQPQPTVAIGWIKQTYMIWGCVAMILLIILWVLALPISRRKFGYEFFRKSHYVLAIIYIGACWGHWSGLKCFLLPSLILWGLDRFIRLVRTGLIHYQILENGQGVFKPLKSRVERFGEKGDVVRLSCGLPIPWSWEVGQHYYVTFLEGGIWQSHPFTPCSTPGSGELVFLFRGKSGETKRIAELDVLETPIVLTGPYGYNILDEIDRGPSIVELQGEEGKRARSNVNVLCLAGGTGITYVLPVLLSLAKETDGLSSENKGGIIQLVWVIRHEEDVEWIKSELETLRSSPKIQILIHTTRDRPQTPTLTTSTSSSSTTDSLRERLQINNSEHDVEKHLEITSSTSGQRQRRPEVKGLIQEYMDQVEEGPVSVFASGPSGMLLDIKREVASWNKPGEVWRGREKGDVRLILDDRGE